MSDYSNEEIKQAASESVAAGTDIRNRVRQLTLTALKQRRLDAAEVREVVRALTEGISLGAEKRAQDMRQALADSMAGLDEALTTSAQATQLALQQLTSKGKEFGDNELKAALANLKKIEEDFLATVSEVADSAGAQVKSELKDLVSHARRAGTGTGRKVAQTIDEFSRQAASAVRGSQAAGLSAARELSSRFTMLASGILAGMADALHDQAKK